MIFPRSSFCDFAVLSSKEARVCVNHFFTFKQWRDLIFEIHKKGFKLQSLERIEMHEFMVYSQDTGAKPSTRDKFSQPFIPLGFSIKSVIQKTTYTGKRACTIHAVIRILLIPLKKLGMGELKREPCLNGTHTLPSAQEISHVFYVDLCTVETWWTCTSVWAKQPPSCIDVSHQGEAAQYASCYIKG